MVKGTCKHSSKAGRPGYLDAEAEGWLVDKIEACTSAPCAITGADLKMVIRACKMERRLTSYVGKYWVWRFMSEAPRALKMPCVED